MYAHTVKHCLPVILFFSFILIQLSVDGQSKLFPSSENGDTAKADLKNVSPAVKAVPLLDLSDVIFGLFRKKRKDTASLNETPVSKPVYSGVAAIGYTLQTRLAATISGNVAFRPDTMTRLSTITTNVTYTQNKQFFWPLQSNIWTKNNRYAFIGDLRYYKYPQSTFGLGSNSAIENEDPMDYHFFRLYEFVLRKIKGDFYGGLGYILDYRWGISHAGTNNGSESDYDKYGTDSKTISSGITINGVYDTRDNPISPLHGIYSSVQLRSNLQVLGSESNWQSLIIDLRKYFLLSKRTQNVLALWSYNWLVLNGRPPYLDLPSNGWDSYSSTGRGYIQGRFRGSQMVYGEGEFRYRISRNGLLGGVVFANVQSFSSEQGSELQEIQPGFGAGLRLKIKKSSRTNLGVDYGFGAQGSRGLFIAVGEYF